MYGARSEGKGLWSLLAQVPPHRLGEGARSVGFEASGLVEGENVLALKDDHGTHAAGILRHCPRIPGQAGEATRNGKGLPLGEPVAGGPARAVDAHFAESEGSVDLIESRPGVHLAEHSVESPSRIVPADLVGLHQSNSTRVPGRLQAAAKRGDRCALSLARAALVCRCIDKRLAKHNTASHSRTMIDTRRLPYYALCLAIGVAFLALSLSRVALASFSFHQAWSGYYTLLVDSSAPMADVVTRLEERVPRSRIVSSVTCTVSFSTFDRTADISVAEVSERFDDLDPRFDDYMRRVGSLFTVAHGDRESHVLYIRSSRNVLVFAASVSRMLRGAEYRWKVAELTVLANLILLGLGAVFLGLLFLRIPHHRVAHLLGALPWLVNCFSGYVTDLLVFYLVFPFWCAFFAEAVSASANAIFFRWQDPDGRDMRNRLASLLIVAVAGCLLTLMMGGNGREIARTLSALGAGLLLVVLWVVWFGIRGGGPRHRVFEPVPIGRRLRRLSASSREGRVRDLPSALAWLRRQLLAQRLPVAILVLVGALSPLVTYLDGLYSDGPVPVPQPLEGEASMSWEGLEKLWHVSRESEFPNLSDYLTHEAYQESLRYARGWEFPLPNEQVIVPDYESLADGHVREVPRVMYEFTPAWLSEVLSEAGEGSVQGLLLRQDRPVRVILSAGNRTTREIRGWKIVLFALVLAVSIALWELYLTPPNLYGTNGWFTRRRKHPV